MFRYAVMQKYLTGIDKHEGGMDKFTKSYERYGLRRAENGVMCREWCPGASAVFIMGDFSKFHIASDSILCLRNLRIKPSSRGRDMIFDDKNRW